MDGKIWMLGQEGVHYRAFVSVPVPIVNGTVTHVPQ